MLIAAGALLAAGGLWAGLIGSTERIPPGWSWKSRFVGTMTYADQTGQLPQRDTLGIYDREITVQSENERPRAVVLKDDYLIRDPLTGQVTWRYTIYPKVDPATGRHLNPEAADDVLVFPRNVERRTYRFRMNYVEGVPLTYVKDDVIDGVDVYLFGYKGRGEYTESYSGTAEYPGVPVEAGQEIKCADDQFIFMIWVEPLTGEALKLAERCDSGDYVFNASTGRPVSAVARWAGESGGRDVLQRAEWVRDERLRLLAAEYAPFAFGLCGIGLAGAGFARRRKSA